MSVPLERSLVGILFVEQEEVGIACRAVRRIEKDPGCPERFELSFFTDWTYPTRSRARHAEVLANLPPGIRGIILRSPVEVAKFTNNLPRSFDIAAGA